MAKILIVRLTSLGDVIFTLPLINALSKEHEISYLVAEKGLDVIKNIPTIKNLHFAPLAEWRKHPFSVKRYYEFYKLIKEIRKEKYDIVLDCQQMFKSLFLVLLSGAQRRITFTDARELSNLACNEFVKPKAEFRSPNYHIVERNLDFARYLNVNVDEIKFPPLILDSNASTKIKTLLKDIDETKKIVVISPETTWKNKHWDIQNWKDLIKDIHNDCNLVVTGINNELYKKIIPDNTIKHYNLVGKTNLEELKSLYSISDVVISPDSGSGNLAWALSTPAIIEIFTCTPSKRFGVYGDTTKYFALQNDSQCKACFKKKCKNTTCVCQKSVTSDEVLKILRKLI